MSISGHLSSIDQIESALRAYCEVFPVLNHATGEMEFCIGFWGAAPQKSPSELGRWIQEQSAKLLHFHYVIAEAKQTCDLFERTITFCHSPGNQTLQEFSPPLRVIQKKIEKLWKNLSDQLPHAKELLTQTIDPRELPSLERAIRTLEPSDKIGATELASEETAEPREEESLELLLFQVNELASALSSE